MKPTFIGVSAAVRYWEDTTVNGVDDVDGSLIPDRYGDNWMPVIRLEDGAVQEWPKGTTAEVHYKVCDAGEYWLLDADKNRIAKWGGYYVPDDFLCHGDDGYGDYIIMNINADGFVEGWKTPEVVWACDCDESDQSGWKRIGAQGGAA